MMCRTYGQFLSRVAAGRNMSLREARKVAKGRIWTGEDALQHGLVDKLGGLTDAVHLAKQEAGLSQVSPFTLHKARSAYTQEEQQLHASTNTGLLISRASNLRNWIFLLATSVTCHLVGPQAFKWALLTSWH